MGIFTIAPEVLDATFHSLTKNWYNDENKKFFWLGTGRIANADKTFKPFEEAREYIRSLGLKNQKEWIEYYKSGNKPVDGPTSPQVVYKNKVSMKTLYLLQWCIK